MTRTQRSVTFVPIFVLAVSALLTAQESPRGSITIDRIADIKYPTEQTWSPDGKSVAFLWDAAGKQDLYMVKPGQPPVALTDFPVDPELLVSNIAHFDWAANDQIIFEKNNALWTVSTSSPQPARLPGYEGTTSFSLSADKKSIAFVRHGQVWVASLTSKAERQLTHLPPELSAAGPLLSPDGKYVSFTAAHYEEVPEPLPFNGDRVRVYRSLNWNNQIGVVSTLSGDPMWIPTSPANGIAASVTAAAVQWVAGPAILYQEISDDRKSRQLRVMSVSGKVRTIWHDHDPAWWSITHGPRSAASPDGKWVAFLSDRTGWPHLYVLPIDATSESQARQLSTGKFGDAYLAWSADSKRIVYAHSAEGNQMERFLSIADVASGAIEPVVTGRGVSFDASFSPDGSMLTYSHSGVEHPLEVYAVAAHTGAKPIRLTNSMPPEILPADLTTPIPVHYASRAADAKQVPATLIVNKHLDRTRKHPAIIWIHGSGSDQNYLGWHPGSYRMYYAMHQYLAQQGYVILTPDYRGSSGYSRDWATGSYRDLGGGETQDVNAGADYLKTLSYVDPDRIGVWGLSYGGFMTLQSIITAPKLFRCAIDVAGVGDWATYVQGGNTLARQGGTSISEPDVYERSAPARHLDKIVDPLMILQGTNDANVPVWETLRIVDSLEKLGKPFEMAFFPGEIHFFRRAFVLRDAWRRSEKFFDKHLKTPDNPITASASGN